LLERITQDLNDLATAIKTGKIVAHIALQPTITASASTPGSLFKRHGGSLLLRRKHPLDAL